MPLPMHEARLAMARPPASTPTELPFVAELLDVLPGEERWRTAIESVLAPVARTLLVDQDRLDDFSDAIDALRLPVRVQFEGVPTGPHLDLDGDPAMVSGKLAVKPSPFSTWVRERIESDRTDARCVASASDLGGGGRRVTESGQLRDGRRGAHGDRRQSNVIGFTNEARVAAVEQELASIAQDLATLEARRTDVAQDLTALDVLRAAHQHVVDATWAAIDVDGLGDVPRPARRGTAGAARRRRRPPDAAGLGRPAPEVPGRGCRPSLRRTTVRPAARGAPRGARRRPGRRRRDPGALRVLARFAAGRPAGPPARGDLRGDRCPGRRRRVRRRHPTAQAPARGAAHPGARRRRGGVDLVDADVPAVPGCLARPEPRHRRRVVPRLPRDPRPDRGDRPARASERVASTAVAVERRGPRPARRRLRPRRRRDRGAPRAGQRDPARPAVRREPGPPEDRRSAGSPARTSPPSAGSSAPCPPRSTPN